MAPEQSGRRAVMLPPAPRGEAFAQLGSQPVQILADPSQDANTVPGQCLRLLACQDACQGHAGSRPRIKAKPFHSRLACSAETPCACRLASQTLKRGKPPDSTGRLRHLATETCLAGALPAPMVWAPTPRHDVEHLAGHQGILAYSVYSALRFLTASTTPRGTAQHSCARVSALGVSGQRLAKGAQPHKPMTALGVVLTGCAPANLPRHGEAQVQRNGTVPH